MMDSISTASAYQSVLNNLMTAQAAQTAAGDQLSSSEKSTDLMGYGAQSETLLAMQATNAQVTGWLSDTTAVGAKLSTQDSALNEVASGAGSAVQAITQALGSGNGSALMQSLQDAFSSAVEGLNTTYNGEYLFAGGQVDTQPVSATSLAQLTSGAPISSFFNNDQLQTTSQINQNTTIPTGFLASQVGTPLFTAFQSVEAYVQANGGFSNPLTTAQSQFLTQQLTVFQSAQTGLTNVVAQNGLLQSETTDAQTDLNSRQAMLQGLISNITSADLPQASANLQQAQLAVQAAGQVFQSLNSTSLLSTLISSNTIA
ncbi:MAG TPA: flagellin [Caulobacteraceae bacterium]|nr:flagellin [Caulobacteraceae bacterium]